MPDLSDREKLEFKRNGFLPVHDAVDPDLIDEARERIWESIPENRADPESLVGQGYHLNVLDEVEDTSVFGEVNEQVFAYAEELVGEDVLEAPTDQVQVPLKFPEENQVVAASELPDHGHVDGYGPNYRETGEVSGFTIGAAVYYDRVQPRGGPFTVWPGSHWVAAQYYTNHVLETPGHAHGDSVPAPLGDAHEVVGDAGTVVLWHNKLVHTGGVNLSPDVRVASISRFRRRDFDEIKRDAADKLWKYWPGLDGLSPDEVYEDVVPFVRETYGGTDDEDEPGERVDDETGPDSDDGDTDEASG